MFDPLVCCLKGIWVQPCSVTPAKLPPDLGIQVHLRSGNDAERGDDGREATEMVFFLCIVRARTHEFAAKKIQGKNRAMQRHEQVLPPCHCIARIEAGEYVRADAIACRWGVGGGK